MLTPTAMLWVFFVWSIIKTKAVSLTLFSFCSIFFDSMLAKSRFQLIINIE